MAFCTRCGRPLQEGEVCGCQNNNGFNNNVNFDVKSETKGIVESAKEIIADPQGGVRKFIAGANQTSMILLTAVYTLIVVLSNVFYKIGANLDNIKRLKDVADDWDMDYEDYIDDFDVEPLLYEAGDIIKGAFTNILTVVAGIVITAAVFYFAIMMIKKVKITWKQAFAIAVVDLMIMIPLLFITEVLDLIPDFKLLSWVINAIIYVRSWGSTILTYLGLKCVCGDSRSTIYVSVPAMAVISIVSSLVSFLITSIL